MRLYLLFLFGLVFSADANAGPFGYSPGDEMPQQARLAGDGFLRAREAPPNLFHRLEVFGTVNSGICGLILTRHIPRGFNSEPDHREFTSWARRLETILVDKYGEATDADRSFENMWIYWSVKNSREVESIYLKRDVEYSPPVMSDVVRLRYDFKNIEACIGDINAGF